MRHSQQRPVSPVPIACGLSGQQFAARREEIARELFQHVEQIDELNDGFAYRFPAFDPWAAKIIAFIDTERRCCSFFTFELIIEPLAGPIWLRLRGSAEIKAFLADELDKDLSFSPPLSGR